MTDIQLYDYQREAVGRMKNGCILCGGVGSGKSRTSLAYYALKGKNKSLYIITTAHKRDTKEWEAELAPFLISSAVVVCIESIVSIFMSLDSVLSITVCAIFLSEFSIVKTQGSDNSSIFFDKKIIVSKVA